MNSKSNHPRTGNSSEQQQIDEIADLTATLLKKRYSDTGQKVLRGVHPKAHGCVDATFQINEDIQTDLQIGLFNTPGKKYQARIRYSNATALVDNDVDISEESKKVTNKSRGMAIKVLDVEPGGDFLQEDCGARNQDFLMINTPSFAFANVSDYLLLNQILVEDSDDIRRFFAPLAGGDFTKGQQAVAAQTFKIVQQISAIPVADPLESSYFGAAPFGFGDKQVMRFTAKPRVAANPQVLPTDPPPNYLKEALDERMKQTQPVVFDFMLQVRKKNENDLVIENATQHWDEAKYPFVKVAVITITAPQTNIATGENQTACENLVFNPWHALAAHEPLGGINRLRKAVYNKSAETRLEDTPSTCPFSGNHT